MNDINDLTVELAKAFNVSKMPPKLKYRFQKWLQGIQRPQPVRPEARSRMTAAVKAEMVNQILERTGGSDLKKNEMMASAFDNGSVQFDFGSEIPDEIRKAAIFWAKKRGLNVVESSLSKSSEVVESILMASKSLKNNTKKCVNRLKWSF